MVLLVSFKIYGQIDQKKLDSLASYIDSSAKVQRYWQDSFNNIQDSIYHSAINFDSSNKGSINGNREKSGIHSPTIFILSSALLLIVAIIVLIARRK